MLRAICQWKIIESVCEQIVNLLRVVMPHDIRAIANFVLDLADQRGQRISNLSINKICFFLHSHFLVEFDRPLVSAKIEAWDYGPVFRELYREFKQYGDRPILGRAHRISAETGLTEICDCEFSLAEKGFLEPLIDRYIRFSASTLVSMSHIRGGPWDQVWNHGTVTQASMRITDDLIVRWHKTASRH